MHPRDPVLNVPEIVKSLQKSILLRDFSDFIEVFDVLDGFAIQS
jgi:hypothetical protein